MSVVRVLKALPRTRNLVVLASDMKGFTARTSSQTREENRRMLALHDELLMPCVRGYGGRKVKALGDAVVAVFESPTDAVLCAMAIQDRLASWNARAAESDRIEVRIALSQGEVRKEGAELVGEPMQLALDAQSLADAGDIVLTDAVYLSMNKQEAPIEVLGRRLLRGGGSIRLRRVLRAEALSAPYGGAALKRLGKLSDPGGSGRVLRKLDPVRRRLPWAAAASLFLAAAAGESQRVAPRDPVLRAAALLDARQPTAALAELDKLAESNRSRTPEVAVLRGKAEQSLGQRGIAFSDFAAAAQVDPRALDDEALAMLAEDLDAESFPQAWRPALVKLLGEGGGRIAVPVRKFVRSPRRDVRTDAIDALELAGAATDDDRVVAASAELADPQAPCPARIKAVQRLAMVRDPRAAELLQSVAATKTCGAKQARDLRRRTELR